MRILVITLSFFLIVFSSCLFEEKHKDVDSFYTAKEEYDFPRTPLIKPFYLSYDKIEKSWDLNYPISLNYGIPMKNANNIGVDQNYIYGYIKENYKIASQYEEGMFVHLRKDGVIVYPN